MATYGYTFNSGDGVTPTRLNAARTVSDIVNADIASAAAIDKTKISGTAITAADTGTVTSAMIADGAIVNADINASAGIVDTKLATISTAGKVSNSATTATNANTANAIVARDASGNFSAGTITAALSGNVTGNVTGNLTGTASAIADGTVSTAKMVDSAVTNAKIASGVDASKLTTGTLPADRIGSSAITTTRINDAAVTAAKLDGAQTGSAPIYGCRAWVNFDGTSVTNVGGEDRCTISGSGNVSKVVRTGTGNYTVTFTTAMPDANYAASTGYNIASGVNCCRVVSRASASCAVITNDGTGGNAANSNSVSVAIFR